MEQPGDLLGPPGVTPKCTSLWSMVISKIPWKRDFASIGQVGEESTQSSGWRQSPAAPSELSHGREIGPSLCFPDQNISVLLPVSNVLTLEDTGSSSGSSLPCSSGPCPLPFLISYH